MALIPDEKPLPVTGLRVLLADDDSRCRSSLASLLAADGFDTHGVDSGQEVLHEINKPSFSVSPVHFLVLDYNMPDLTGLDVLRKVKNELGLRLPAILVSGEFSLALQRTVLEEGGFALVPKPVQPIPFRHLVWELVRREFGS